MYCKSYLCLIVRDCVMNVQEVRCSTHCMVSSRLQKQNNKYESKYYDKGVRDLILVVKMAYRATETVISCTGKCYCYS